ncbi:MAG: hypothetical protein AB7I33_17695 [Gemmatimonadales bacterium]
MKIDLVNKYLFAGNVSMFLLLAAMFLSGFTRQDAKVLTIERLNIVDSTGKLALVLANGARLPGGTFGGKEYPQSYSSRGKSAGMIFYNEMGDEVGGLIYEGAQHDSTYSAFGHFSFDQWQQNQVVAVQYSDNGRSRSAGLRVWDRPTDAPLEEQFALAEKMSATPRGPVRDSLNRERLKVRDKVAGSPRLFLGSRDRLAALELQDPQGRVRVRLSVDSLGVARLGFLDADGKVTAVYP